MLLVSAMESKLQALRIRTSVTKLENDLLVFIRKYRLNELGVMFSNDAGSSMNIGFLKLRAT